MSDTPANPRVLLTSADIDRWEAEARAMDAKISALVVEKDALSKRLAAAKLFMADAAQEPPLPIAMPAKIEPRPSPVKRSARKGTIGKQWQDVIMSIVRRYDRGCTYSELRTEISNSPLGPRLAESDKSYQRAMSKLGHAGSIERAWGRVFTPKAFEAFRRDLEAGAVSPIVSQPMARSPMGEAILKIAYDAPGLKGKQIIGELRRDPEFNAALTPHETGAYNIIARLVRRQQLVKRDDGGCFPGIAFPYNLLGLAPKGDRAPSSSAAGALSAGEGATSPSDNRQSGFRLVS